MWTLIRRLDGSLEQTYIDPARYSKNIIHILCLQNKNQRIVTILARGSEREMSDVPKGSIQLPALVCGLVLTKELQMAGIERLGPAMGLCYDGKLASCQTGPHLCPSARS